MRRFNLISLAMLMSCLAFAQFKQTAVWQFDASKKEVRTGDEIELIFRVEVIDDWYIYSSDIGEDVGPIPTGAVFEENGSFEVIGDLVPVNPKEKYDNIWEANITYFAPKGEFRQKIKVLSKL